MKANEKVLEHLQQAIAMELAAINQYMLHAHVLEDWSINRLAAKMREEMIEEQGHVDAFTRRIMFLGGNPELVAAKAPTRADTLERMFEVDLHDEQEAIAFYTTAARHAQEVGDIGTRTLFETVVLDEEGHMSGLEAQLGLLKRIGEAAYISHNLGAAEPGAAVASV